MLVIIFKHFFIWILLVNICMGLLTPFKWAILMVGPMCTPKVKAVSAHMGFIAHKRYSFKFSSFGLCISNRLSRGWLFRLRTLTSWVQNTKCCKIYMICLKFTCIRQCIALLCKYVSNYVYSHGYCSFLSYYFIIILYFGSFLSLSLSLSLVRALSTQLNSSPSLLPLRAFHLSSPISPISAPVILSCSFSSPQSKNDLNTKLTQNQQKKLKQNQQQKSTQNQ